MIQINKDPVDIDFANFYWDIDTSEEFILRSSTNTMRGLKKIHDDILSKISSLEKFLPKETPPSDDELEYAEYYWKFSEYNSVKEEESYIIEIMQQQRQLFFTLNYCYFEIWLKNFYDIINKKYSLSILSRDNKIENLWKAIKCSFSDKLNSNKFESQWNTLKAFSSIRNCIAHSKSDITLTKNKNQIISSVKKLKKEISIESNQLILGEKFLVEFQKYYSKFFYDLQSTLAEKK